MECYITTKHEHEPVFFGDLSRYHRESRINLYAAYDDKNGDEREVIIGHAELTTLYLDACINKGISIYDAFDESDHMADVAALLYTSIDNIDDNKLRVKFDKMLCGVLSRVVLIKKLYLVPGARGKGLGNAILEALDDETPENSLTVIQPVPLQDSSFDEKEEGMDLSAFKGIPTKEAEAKLVRYYRQSGFKKAADGWLVKSSNAKRVPWDFDGFMELNIDDNA